VPLAPLPKIQKITSNPQPPVIPPRYVIKAGGIDTDLLVPQHGFARPIVRGLRRRAQDDFVRVDILESGLVDFWYNQAVTQGRHFQLLWFFASYLSVLDYVDWMRSVAGAPDWEFAIEVGFAARALTRPNLVLGVIYNPSSDDSNCRRSDHFSADSVPKSLGSRGDHQSRSARSA
jgi:hypothetical protein